MSTTAELIAARLEALRALLIDTHTLDELPTYTEIVDGLLVADSLAYLQGKPGSCKSLLALDLAGRVATGTTWCGRVTKKSRVLYLYAEGTSGLKARVRAWEIANGLLMYGVSFLPVAVQVLDPIDGTAFALLAEQLAPGFIIVDTMARTTVGVNENSAEDMGRYVEQMDRIRAATGACILMVHHERRDGVSMRGSTVSEGAAQTVLRCSRDANTVTVSVIKQKDGEAGDPTEFAITPSGLSVVLELIGRLPDTGNIPVEAVRAVSAFLETRDGEAVSHNQVRLGVGLRGETTLEALALLARLGNVAMSTGPRGAKMVRLITPFGPVTP